MRCLALDVGDERIGVAISDANAFLARPLGVVARRPGPSSYLQIAEIIAQNGVELVVVGLPLLPDGTEGKQVRSTRAYIRGLQGHVATPVVYWDERSSTRRATEIMVESGRGRRRQRRAKDAVAAAVILQEYLDDRSGA
ncbi:MAG TPA: Holliday junction resolvase RuvX [Anaerolineae bacterium]|nr:Holliday junction resolvase RuvX [Anaerolineae bacterium]